MICPECQKEGLESKVYENLYSGMKTLLYCSPYYDEKGAYHHHDSNRTTLRFICSNKHQFEKITYGKCISCDWTGGTKERKD